MNLNRLEDNRFYNYAFFLNIIWMVVGPSIFFLIMAATFYKGADANNLTDPYSLSAYMLGNFLSQFAPIIVSVAIFRRAFMKGLVDFKKNWINYILIILIAFGLIVIFNAIAGIIYDTLGVEGTSENQATIELALSLDIRPFIVITILILAPIIEEFIFRKFLIKFLKGRMSSNWLPYIISIFIFAIIHMGLSIDDLVFLPAYLILSSFITLGYKYSNDNIYVSIGIHFLNNLLSLVAV